MSSGAGVDAGALERAACSRRGARRPCRAPRVADDRDPPVALPQQVGDRELRAGGVVDQHRVGVGPGRRAVEEHRVADEAGAGDVAVVGAGGNDQQRVDAPAQQRGHQLALASRVLARGGGDQQARVLARDVLDRLGDAARRTGWRRPRSPARSCSSRRRCAGWPRGRCARSRAPRSPPRPCCSVAGVTPGSPLITRETVLRLTPAAIARSFIVVCGRAAALAAAASDDRWLTEVVVCDGSSGASRPQSNGRIRLNSVRAARSERPNPRPSVDTLTR